MNERSSRRHAKQKKKKIKNKNKRKAGKNVGEKSMPALPTLLRPFQLHGESIRVLAHFYFYMCSTLSRCVKNVTGKYEKSLHMFTFCFCKNTHTHTHGGQHVTKTRKTVQICQTSSKRFNLMPRAQMLSIFLGASQPRLVTHNLWLMMTQPVGERERESERESGV